jgi:hypothetical protein
MSPIGFNAFTFPLDEKKSELFWYATLETSFFFGAWCVTGPFLPFSSAHTYLWPKVLWNFIWFHMWGDIHSIHLVVEPTGQ